MSTTTEKEFDYKEYYKTHDLDRTKINSYEERERRLKALARDKTTVRIDKSILDKFQQLAPEKEDWEALIQIALQEWLERQQQKKTVRDDIHDLLQEALSSGNIVINMPTERTGELSTAI